MSAFGVFPVRSLSRLIHHRRTIAEIVLAVLLVLLLAAWLAPGVAGAGGWVHGGSDLASFPHTYGAMLTGAEEVPPVTTDATGSVGFRDEDTVIRFRLRVNDIVEAFAAHIHCAPPGQNGSVGVTLASGVLFTGSGTLTSSFTAPDAGNGCGWVTLDDVVNAMASGNTYVNVHTNAHPGGEIRGQLQPLH